MSTICPSCRSAIAVDDINVSTDLALCRACGKSFRFSEIAGEISSSGPDLNSPPPGAFFEQLPDGFRVGYDSFVDGSVSCSRYLRVGWRFTVRHLWEPDRQGPFRHRAIPLWPAFSDGELCLNLHVRPLHNGSDDSDKKLRSLVDLCRGGRLGLDEELLVVGLSHDTR
jgi:hypothetical protein